ncbi:MAG: prepilin-type N-terminal cleavage/methylation domain-containing protein, partial [Myxococcales bacterium]|nr:prepilin-type N-terminal cleavage/methylation domain-containing protein [Myxococcales bacterium]
MGAQTLHRRLARRGGAGFTVVEILIAVAVTAVGFAAIFSMQIGTMQGNIAAREMASAVNL